MRSFLFRPAVAGCLVLLWTTCAFGQDIPVEVPSGLSSPMGEKLNARRGELFQNLQKLKDRISAHNSGCGNVRKGSKEDRDCLEKLKVLQKEAGAYSNDVREFNKVVLQVVAAYPAEAVAGEKLRDAPASKSAPDRSKLHERAMAAFALAVVSVQNVDYDSALYYMKIALDSEPNNVHIQRAYNAALQLKKTRIEIKPAFTKADYLLNALDYGKGDWEASLNYLSRIQARDPKNTAACAALKNLNEVYAEFLTRQAMQKIQYDDFAGALAFMKKAHEKNPTDKTILDVLLVVQDLAKGNYRGKGK